MFPYDSDEKVQYVSLMRDGNPVVYATVYDITRNSFCVKGIDTHNYKDAEALISQIITESTGDIYYYCEHNSLVLKDILRQFGFICLSESGDLSVWKLFRNHSNCPRFV